MCTLPLTCPPISSLPPFIPFLSHYHPGGKKKMPWKFLCSSGLRHFTLNKPKTKIPALNFNKLASPAHLLIARGGIIHVCLWPCLQSLLTPINSIIWSSPLVTSHLVYPTKFPTGLLIYSLPHLQAERRERMGEGHQELRTWYIAEVLSWSKI